MLLPPRGLQPTTAFILKSARLLASPAAIGFAPYNKKNKPIWGDARSLRGRGGQAQLPAEQKLQLIAQTYPHKKLGTDRNC
jgi:hypothetical protein